MIRKTKWTKWNDDLKSIATPQNDEYNDGQQVSTGMAISTPMGMLPVPMTNMQFVSDKVTFHILETNFNITNGIISVIATVSGVTSVEPMTRYSARIGVPTSGLFNDLDVQEAVDIAIINHFNKQQDLIIQEHLPNIKQKVTEFRDHLNRNKEFWTLLVLPNGNMEVVTTEDSHQQYIDKSNLLKQTCKLVGGSLLTSEDAETFNG